MIDSPFPENLAPKTAEESEKTYEESVKTEEPKELEYVKILREHNYIESDIPINSRYWKVRP